MNYTKFLTISLFGFMLAITANNGVVADESVTSMETNSLGLEEIIVTARKREESLLDIPETVVAISGKTISRQNIKNLDKIGIKNYAMVNEWKNTLTRGKLDTSWQLWTLMSYYFWSEPQDLK